MGISTDAMLMWGIDLGCPGENGVSFQQLIEAALTKEERVEHELEEADSSGFCERGDDFYELGDVLRELHGVHLTVHCDSDRCPGYLLGTDAVSASRGNPQAIASLPEPTPEVRAFIEKVGAALNRKPGVWLASYYG